MGRGPARPSALGLSSSPTRSWPWRDPRARGHRPDSPRFSRMDEARRPGQAPRRGPVGRLRIRDPGTAGAPSVGRLAELLGSDVELRIDATIALGGIGRPPERPSPGSGPSRLRSSSRRGREGRGARPPAGRGDPEDRGSDRARAGHRGQAAKSAPDAGSGRVTRSRPSSAPRSRPPPPRPRRRRRGA